MMTRAFFRILVLLSRVLRQNRNLKTLHRKVSNVNGKFQRYPSLVNRSNELSEQTLVFSVEGAVLRSSSLFPYFMLVAFEAGSFVRALVLLLFYPLICLVGEEMGLKVMVMVCFLGIKKDSFRVGKNVLPKFFLDDVGFEGFEVLKRGKRAVAVSDMPQIMVESVLKDYLDVEHVVGRELKEFCGYYVGLFMEEKKDMVVLDEIFEEKELGCDVIGIKGPKKSPNHHLFAHCKEIYLTSEGERRRWQQLPRDKYPKPLIFHDGRLALRPTPLATLAIFIWFPFGLFLAIIRVIIALSLPYNLSSPILAFSGLRLKTTKPKTTPISIKKDQQPKGLLYVCNHRTLLDPLYLCFALKKDLNAVTYSLSRMSEILAPIKTVRLMRDRDQDAMMMDKLLNQGDLVVCPEGTTCREPYILRFSPLFSEMSNDIVPVAMDTQVSLFYGTTASGFKCLDPIFFLMNPFPLYSVKLLDEVSGSSTCLESTGGSGSSACHDCIGESRFQVANHVQEELGKALGFECTKLTRKDKYFILAGNEGKVSSSITKQRILY